MLSEIPGVSCHRWSFGLLKVHLAPVPYNSGAFRASHRVWGDQGVSHRRLGASRFVVPGAKFAAK